MQMLLAPLIMHITEQLAVHLNELKGHTIIWCLPC